MSWPPGYETNWLAERLGLTRLNLSARSPLVGQNSFARRAAPQRLLFNCLELFARTATSSISRRTDEIPLHSECEFGLATASSLFSSSGIITCSRKR